MSDPVVNPAANQCKLIAQCLISLAAHVEALGSHLANTQAVPAAPPADKPAKEAKPKKEKAVAADPPKSETPEMTPAQVAADLKAKLVVLVGKDRAKAISTLGSVGAKNFSTIPVEKHLEVLRLVDAALNPAPADPDDPLA